MLRISPNRSDKRTIEEKALGLIFAMDDQQAANLLSTLRRIAKADSRRAKMFVGPDTNTTSIDT